MSRSNEYLADRLNAEIRTLQSRLQKLTEENDALHSECKFGAAVSLILGILLGTAVGIGISTGIGIKL